MGRHAKKNMRFSEEDSGLPRNLYERLRMEYGGIVLHKPGENEVGMSGIGGLLKKCCVRYWMMSRKRRKMRGT